MHYTSSGSILGIHGVGGYGYVGGGMPGFVGQPPLQAYRQSIFEQQVAGYGPLAAGPSPTLSGSWGHHSGTVYGNASVMGWR